jgi:hypothetical protein
MKIKRILPILLLLSMCVGLLTSCSLVAAEESPIVTQAQTPAVEGQPADNGIFTITDDERFGDVYAKILSGEVVFECVSKTIPSWAKESWDMSNLYVNEYFMKILEQLNTYAVEPITEAQYEEAVPFFENKFLSPVEDVFSARSKSSLCFLRLQVGGEYIRFIYSSKDEDTQIICFKTEQKLNDLRNEVHAFWEEEYKNPYHGIANSGKVGETWRKYMSEDSPLPKQFGKILIWNENNGDLLAMNTVTEVEKQTALLDIFKQLEGIAVAELEDTDLYGNYEKWELSNRLIAFNVDDATHWSGMEITLYSDGLTIYSVETGETAYFSVVEGGPQSIKKMIVDLF